MPNQGERQIKFIYLNMTLFHLSCILSVLLNKIFVLISKQHNLCSICCLIVSYNIFFTVIA